MTDLEFVQRCASGDKAACDEFVEKYSRLIYKYINSVLKQYNPGLATEENTDDIFQEIIVVLSRDNFKKLKTFKAKNGCSLASWLRQVTVNSLGIRLDSFKRFAASNILIKSPLLNIFDESGFLCETEDEL